MHSTAKMTVILVWRSKLDKTISSTKIENIGAIDVVNQPGGFSDDDIRIMNLFSDQAAIAIENAHLHQQAEKLAVMEERQRLARERLLGANIAADSPPVEEVPAQLRPEAPGLRPTGEPAGRAGRIEAEAAEQGGDVPEADSVQYR